MWVVGSSVFLIPATVIAVQLLSNRRPAAGGKPVPVKETSLDAIFAVGRGLALPSRLLRRRLRAETIEAVSFVILFIAAGLCLASLASRGSEDDDQALRLSQMTGPFVVSIFGLPGDLDAGRSEFNVLVQDRDTLQVVQDASITLQATRDGTSQSTETVPASAEDSENKLLQNAELDLPAAGDWVLSVRVSQNDAGDEAMLPLRVVKPESGITVHWAYVVFVSFAAILLFIYWRRHRVSANIQVRRAHKVVAN
jgi:hypothetical protein